MKLNRPAAVVALAVLLGACGGESSIDSTSLASATSAPTSLASIPDSVTTTVVPAASTTSTITTIGAGRGVGRNSNMMERHRAPVPAEYARLTNPVEADEASLARGDEAYASCAACHGDGGLGDGPAAVALDPPPVNIAHTSQMMGDGYQFWRITEGGSVFDTSMPAWGEVLDEQTRWDLINYIQALGAGTVTPGRRMGGQAFDPEAQAVQQAALLAIAVEQGLITQDESDGFSEAHELVDPRMAEARGSSPTGGVDTLLTEVLIELVASGDLTPGQADMFRSVHDRLSEAGLLP